MAFVTTVPRRVQYPAVSREFSPFHLHDYFHTEGETATSPFHADSVTVLRARGVELKACKYRVIYIPELQPMAAFVYVHVPPSRLDTWMGNSPEHESAFTFLGARVLSLREPLSSAGFIYACKYEGLLHAQ